MRSWHEVIYLTRSYSEADKSPDDPSDYMFRRVVIAAALYLVHPAEIPKGYSHPWSSDALKLLLRMQRACTYRSHRNQLLREGHDLEESNLPVRFTSPRLQYS